MNTKSYYDILDISENATGDEVKKAFHKKSLLYHPDKHQNDPLYKLAEDKQKELNEAYHTLSDPIKRQAHNLTIHIKPTIDRKSEWDKKTSETKQDNYNNTQMVLIQAGEFQMGSDYGECNEKPIHTVYLDAFYMDIYEVTNAQYRKFIDATRYIAPLFWNDTRFNQLNHPVVGVSWHDAKAYADWAGKRLPTEAEWEKAARGGLVRRKYPWGITITHDYANYSGTGGKDVWTYTSPVGSFAPNGYGLYDMAGNVWEWCEDWYDRNYYTVSLRSNPTGPSYGIRKVLRGGSWYNFDNNLRITYRNYFCDWTSNIFYVGFRCVRDVPK